MSSIVCSCLTDPFSWDFGTELARLRQGLAVPLKQPKRAPAARPFYGATAGAAHDGVHLYVVAEMEDIDIFNTATSMNQRTWMTGDAFEIFLRPAGQEAYYEFHVTPDNQILQLRLPNMADFYDPVSLAEKSGAFTRRLLPDKIIESRAEILRESERWRVMVSIPLGRLCENKQWEVGDIWTASFCRYDYTRAAEEPVVSSTSDHGRPDFHNQPEWRRLVFNSGDSLY